MSINKFRRPSDIQAGSDESKEWFRKKLKSINRSSINRNKIMRDGLDPDYPYSHETMTPYPGKMYMFFYDPKTKKTLEYYDKFPLVILLDTFNGGFEGLNLHYLDVRTRQKFFYGGLLETVSDERFDEMTRFKVTYDRCQSARSLKPFKPCFKKYLTTNVRGSIVLVPSEEWELAVHLPTADFAKKDQGYVHEKSREMIGKF
jgi:hypothetical protein